MGNFLNSILSPGVGNNSLNDSAARQQSLGNSLMGNFSDTPMQFAPPVPGYENSIMPLTGEALGAVGNYLATQVVDPIKKTMGPLYGEMGGTADDVLAATMMGIGGGWPGRGVGPSEIGQINANYLKKLRFNSDPAIQKAIKFQNQIDEAVAGGRKEFAQNPEKRFFESNAEYKMSADPDLLCQKSAGCDLAIGKLKTELGPKYRPEIAYEFIERAQDEALRVACPQCYVNSARTKPGGAMQKRLIVGEGGYAGEISRLTDSTISEIPSGALRNYSSTDFRPTHLPGQITQKVEASQMGIPEGSYSKVKGYADIFGPAGEYINMSIGRDELVGMNVKDAVAARNAHKNVGTVYISYTDAETIKARNSQHVDHVIPWHSSGKGVDRMRKELKDPDVKDFTGFQNETIPKKDMSQLVKADVHLNPLEYGSDVKKYLDLCREANVIPKFPQFMMDEASIPQIYAVLDKVKEVGNAAPFWNFVHYNQAKIDPAYMKFVGPEYGKFMGEFPYKPADMSKVDLQKAQTMLTEYLKDPESLIPRREDYLRIADEMVKEYGGKKKRKARDEI